MAVINVVFATDDAWAPFAGAALSSVCSSSPPDERFVFHVLTLGLSEENIAKFRELETQLGQPIKIHVVNAAELGLPTPKNYAREVYLRLYIADLLPDVNKVVYLDGDVVVLRSIRELHDFDVAECAGAAALDQLYVNEDAMAKYYSSIGMKEPRGYFNAGIMVINLSYWREACLGRKCLDWLNSYAEIGRFAEQDALNVVLEGRIRFVPSRWNVTASLVHGILYKGRLASNFRHVLDHAAIIHFTGHRKPWKRELKVPFAKHFCDHLRRTPWGEEAFQPFTLSKRITRVSQEIRHVRKLARSAVKSALRIGPVYKESRGERVSPLAP